MQSAVACTTKRRDVVASAAVGETTALGEVGPGEQCVDETRDFVGVSGPVGVEHDDDVAGGGLETACERVALALAGLLDDANVSANLAGGVDGSVDGSAVDQDQFVVVGQ